MKEYLLKPITETAEQARQAKGQKGKIAKQIALGIDAHLKGYQLCRKIDAGGLQPVQSFSLEGCAPARPSLHVSTLLFAASANALLRYRSGGSFPVLFFHLHFLWTCGAGSRGSASLVY